MRSKKLTLSDSRPCTVFYATQKQDFGGTAVYIAIKHKRGKGQKH